MMAIPLTWGLIKLTNNPYSGVIIITVLQFACIFGELYFANKYLSVDWKYYLQQVVLRCWLTFACSFLFVYILNKVIELSFYLELPLAFICSLFFVYYIGLNREEKKMVGGLISKIAHKIH